VSRQTSEIPRSIPVSQEREATSGNCGLTSSVIPGFKWQVAQCLSTSAKGPSHRHKFTPSCMICERLSTDGHRARAEAMARRADSLGSGFTKQGDPQREHIPLDFVAPMQPSQHTCPPFPSAQVSCAVNIQ